MCSVMFGKSPTAYHHKPQTVNRGGGGVMIWAFSAATGPGKSPVSETTMKSTLYQNIPETNVRPSV
uniref:Uncharacterized protein n=1 Tax=Monopterus albus TaxID=43700 RepID=A0A3Q3J0W7_MONAL